MARLVPVKRQRRRELFVDEGLFTLPDDFNELPDDVVSSSKTRSEAHCILIAQAQIERLQILTADPRFDLYDVEVMRTT